MSVPEYCAGEWTAVVRPGFVALLGPGAAESTLRALWQDAGEGVFAALALLARDGFGGLPPFAVVSVDGQRVHAALRGDVEVVVEVDGRRDVWRSGEVSTWTERVLEGASDVVVQLDGVQPGVRSLPLADGIASASRVRVGLTARDGATTGAPEPVVAAEPAPVEPESPAVPEPAPVEPESQVVPESAPVVLELPAEPEAPVESRTLHLVEPASDSAPTATSAVPSAEQVAAEAPEPEPDPEPDAAPVQLVDDVIWDEPTQVELVPLTFDSRDHGDHDDHDDLGTPADPTGVVAEAEALLTPPPGPGTAPVRIGGASLDDHDGLTILSTDLAEIREQLPSWAADELPGAFRAPAAAGTPARLVLSTGLVVPLDRAVLLGRAPQVARVTNRELPRLITVPSPQQDISRTHAEVRVEGDHVVVTDLDSTNGVHVARAGEGSRRLHPGEPSVVGVDEVVDLGDGVTFSVERGS